MALRAAAFYTGSQVGNAFGGLFAIGILTLDNAHGIAGWRWLFIVEGAMTFGGEYKASRGRASEASVRRKLRKGE
jgi:MFS family permease